MKIDNITTETKPFDMLDFLRHVNMALAVCLSRARVSNPELAAKYQVVLPVLGELVERMERHAEKELFERIKRRTEKEVGDED